MAHPSVYMCDFAEGKNLVPFTAEDIAYYGRLKQGGLEIAAANNKMLFKEAGGKSYEIEELGPMDSVVENNCMGSRDVPKGVIGMLARKGNYNAVETGSYADINGGAIRTTPFRLYRISE